MDAVVQQILMNPPEVIIKEEPVVKEESECDVGAAAQQDFEFVSVKEEPVEGPDESTSPTPEESCEEKVQDQQSPPIIKEEIEPRCNCEAGCRTKNCRCRKMENPCSERCHCNTRICLNRPTARRRQENEFSGFYKRPVDQMKRKREI